MMATIWVLTGISVAVVGVRLYAQFINRHLDLGDAIMTLSMVCAKLSTLLLFPNTVQICGIMLCSMLTTQYHYGLGRHFFYLSPYQRVHAIEFNFLGQAFGM